MGMENYSLADIRAATHDNDGCNNGWGGDGGWFWIVVLFLFMFGFGGNGMWGNNGNLQGALTRSDLCEGFNFQNIENGIRGLSQGLCDGFYAMNTTMLQTGNTLGTQILENRFAQKECCCETNRNIDAVRAENYRNTCEITTAIHSEGEQTRALINQNTMQALRDKLEERDRELLSKNFQISQADQSQYLMNQLRPCPIPAYLTCSPYQSAMYPFGYNGYNGYGYNGCNGGCNCA